MVGTMKRLERLGEEARHVKIAKDVDAKLELCVLWAARDVDGPSAGEVKIGVSTRSAIREEIKKMRQYRAADVVVVFEAIISVRGKAEQVRKGVLNALAANGRAYKSWRTATDGELIATVGKVAATVGVRLMSKDEAVALEHEEFDKRAAAIERELIEGIG